MSVDLKALRELATRATPGPWHDKWDDVAHRAREDPDDQAVIVADHDASTKAGGPIDGVVVGLLWYDGWNVAVRKADAAFISACSPDRVLALLRRVEVAEAACEALSAHRDLASDISNANHDAWSEDEATGQLRELNRLGDAADLALDAYEALRAERSK